VIEARGLARTFGTRAGEVEAVRGIDLVNPLKHVVDGVRALFLDGAASTVIWGIVATLALVAAGLVLGTRTFETESG
jgi:ABC-2 type transport system permease protein